MTPKTDRAELNKRVGPVSPSPAGSQWSEELESEFSESLADLFLSVDHLETFAKALLRLIEALHPSRNVFVHVYGARGHILKAWHRPPELDVSNYDKNGLHYLDPFSEAVRSGRTGVLTLSEVSPPGFRESDYFGRIYSDFGIADELIHSVKQKPGLYLGAGAALGKPFPAEAIKRHEAAHPIVRSCLLRMEELLHRAGFSENDDLMDDIGDALERFGVGLLTARERDVIGLILRGHNSESVAQQLGISSNTARHHRTSAYRKLKVSSQGELFYAFLHTVRRTADEA
jgi:DNA-binding CsgD family transcriptional regulator